MTTAAFFDLDGTLIAGNSGTLWTLRERRLGRLSRWQLVQAAAMIVSYRLSIVDMDRAMRKALAIYRGVQEAEVDRWTREWFQKEVVPLFTPGGRAALARHREAGQPVVLLTSSSPYLSAAVTEHLGLDGWISTRYELQGGLFTGAPELPICYGQGKVARAEAYAKEHGIDLDNSTFYSDSYTDLPMLLRVSHPAAVNPDFRLRRFAHRRGWPVLDWQNGIRSGR